MNYVLCIPKNNISYNVSLAHFYFLFFTTYNYGNIYIYIYIYIYICVCVCMCMCICVYVYLFIYTRTHTHTYIYIQLVSIQRYELSSNELFGCLKQVKGVYIYVLHVYTIFTSMAFEGVFLTLYLSSFLSLSLSLYIYIYIYYSKYRQIDTFSFVYPSL